MGALQTALEERMDIKFDLINEKMEALCKQLERLVVGENTNI